MLPEHILITRLLAIKQYEIHAQIQFNSKSIYNVYKSKLNAQKPIYTSLNLTLKTYI